MTGFTLPPAEGRRQAYSFDEERPHAHAHAYGVVRPSSGQVIRFLAYGVGIALFSKILAAFARDVGAGADKRILLVLDGAGWHARAPSV